MCNCYVKDLDPEAQFCLHYGAHNPTCPVYRESGDELDRKWDNIYRADHEIHPSGARMYQGADDPMWDDPC